MKQPGSSFVTWVGLGLVAVLILVADYFDMGGLENFLIVVLLLCLTAFLWGRFSLKRIEVDCGGEDCCGFPGQTLELPARLKNRKALPLVWLDMSIAIGDKTCIAPTADAIPEDGGGERELRSAFVWVMPHQSISWRQTALAVHRGVCRVERVKLHSGDGFGLSTQTAEAELPCPVRFVVYPKIVPVDASPILNNLREMESASNGFYTDRTLLESTRDYREGDSFKSINWRLLARRDELQVNVYEKLTMRRVCFVPDMFSFTHMEEIMESGGRCEMRVTDKSEMEDMFSLLASLILKLHERGVLCSLVIPGENGAPGRTVIPETGEDQVMELLSALAETEYEAGETALPWENIAVERHRLGQIYVFSRDYERSLLSLEPGAGEELGAIAVLREDSGRGAGDGRIYLMERDLRNP